MDKKVTIESRGKSTQTRAEIAAAMAAMQQIASDQTSAAQFGIPPRMESGLMPSARMTAESRECNGVHQHVTVSGKEMQKYKIPVDATGPVLFACSGDGIERVNLYVGGTLLSSTKPSTEVEAPNGLIMYMIDFLGKPLRGELIKQNTPVIVEFIIDGDDLPTLALLYANVPHVEFTAGVYEEPVTAHGDAGTVELMIVYTPNIVGFRHCD